MPFSRRKAPKPTDGTFLDGFLDGYASLLPGREPDEIKESTAPIGMTQCQWGYKMGLQQARLDSSIIAAEDNPCQ